MTPIKWRLRVVFIKCKTSIKSKTPHPTSKLEDLNQVEFRDNLEDYMVINLENVVIRFSKINLENVVINL